MSQERVGIIVELQGADEALNKLNAISKVISRLNKQKINIDLGNGQQLKGLVTATQQTQRLGNEMVQTSAKAKTMRQMMRSTFNNISSRVMHAGQQMQVLGKTLTQISSPMRSLMRSTVFAGGFAVLDKVSSGLSSAFSRYDTMKMYPRIMKQIGFSDTQATKSIEELNKAVDGLPTGLDEIVDMAQKFTLSLGDIEEGTKVAIAANNAFLASGTDEASRYQGMLQLRDLLNGKDLNAKEWMSLTSAMGPAIREMGKQFGYTDENMQEFIQSVNAGELSTKDFLEALKDVGLEGGKVYDMARETMNTWQAFTARIGTAFSRMGFGILESLDEVIKVMTGDKEASLNTWLDDQVIPGINNLTASIKEWISANPDLIIDFLNTIRSFDFGGLFRGMGKGFLTTAREYLEFFKVFAGKDAEGFGRFMARAGFYGKVLNIMGGFFKGSRGIIATLGAILGLPVMKIKASKNGQSSILGKMLSHVGSVNQAKKLQKVMKEMPTVTQTMRRVFASLSGMMKLFGTVALGTGTAWITVRAVRDGIKMLREIAKEFGEMSSEEWIYAGGAMAGFGIFVMAFSKAASYVGSAMSSVTTLSQFFSLPAIKGGLIIGGIATFLTALVDLNAHLVAGSFRAFRDAVDWLKEGLEGLKDVGKIHVNVSKVEKQLDLMRQVMGIFNKSYEADEHSGGSGASMVTRASMVKTMSEIIENTKKAMTDLNTLPEISDQQIDDAKTKVNNTIGALKAIYDELIKPTDSESNISNGSSNYQARTNESIVKGVAGIIKSIKDSLTDLKELEELDVELDVAKTNAVEVGEKMSEIFTALNTAFGMQETHTFEGGEESGVGKGSVTFNAGVTWQQKMKAGNLRDVLKSYQEGITALREAYQTIMGNEGDMQFSKDDFAKKMSGLTDEKDGIIAKLKEMFDKLKTGFGDNDVDIETPMQEFAKAVGSIKQMVTTMSEIEGIEFTGEEGLGGVIQGINQMVRDLQTAFDPAIVQGVIEQITGFITVVDNLLQQIQTMQGMSAENPVEVAITINPTGDMGKAVIDKLGEIYDDIMAAWHLIPESLTKTIDIVIKYDTSNVQSFPDLGVPTSFPHTGGYIAGAGKVLYRSKGGEIFRPRGTDIVPAMLSYGEYVESKRAVDFFGIDFMRKVNNLDYRGALNSLLGRANAMAKGSTVINNYDNRSVTINGADVSNAGFTFKRASRFVGAI